MAKITIDGIQYEVEQAVRDAYIKKSESAAELIRVKGKLAEAEDALSTVKSKFDGEDYRNFKKYGNIIDSIPEEFRNEEGIKRLLRSRHDADEYQILVKQHERLEGRYNKLKESIPEGFDPKKYGELLSKEQKEIKHATIQKHIDASIKAASEHLKVDPSELAITEPFMKIAWTELEGLDINDKELPQKVDAIMEKTWGEQVKYNEAIRGSKNVPPKPGMSGIPNNNSDGSPYKVPDDDSIIIDKIVG